jgi:hypothetical protein
MSIIREDEALRFGKGDWGLGHKAVGYSVRGWEEIW